MYILSMKFDLLPVIGTMIELNWSNTKLWRRQWHPSSVLCLENPMDGGAW